MNFSNRIPCDPNVRSEWENALKTQQCGSSNLICMEHFVPDNYTISTMGKIHLKSGAIPTVFDICVIEVDENDNILNVECFDESQSNECSNATCKEERTELQNLKSVNMKLLENIKQIKWNHKSEKNVLIHHLKELNLKKSKELLALKKEVVHYKDENEKLQRSYSKIHGILDQPEVNIF